MRQIVSVLIIFLFFNSAFAQQNSKKIKNAPASAFSNRKTNNKTIAVKVYENGKQQSVKTFVNGILTKEESVYELDKRKIKGVTRYYYAKDGKINATEEWKNGKKISHQDRDFDFDVNLVAQYLYSVDLLKKKGIEIPLPGLIFSQLKDTATVFDIADTQNDFKKETSADGDLKSIKFIGFNKNIRFDPTLLEIGSDQIVTGYELVLKNNFPSKEIYNTGASELKNVSSAEIIREYFYTDKRLIKLVTTSSAVQKDGKIDKIVTENKFVYTN